MPSTTVAELNLYDWGGPEGAPVLLLLHGLTDSGEAWGDAVARWTPTYRVLSWDARGHGMSPRFAPEQLSAGVAETMVADAIAVLEKLASDGLRRPVLVGHSMGGGTAGNVAGLRPDLVSAVVLEDPALGIDPSESHEDRRKAGEQRVRDAELWRTDPDTAWAQGLAENPGWPEVEYAAWARSKGQSDLAMLATGQARVLRPWGDVAAAMTAPALLVAADTNDLWNGDQLDQLAALGNPNLQIERIPGSRHCVRRTATEAFHALVDPWIAAHA